MPSPPIPRSISDPHVSQPHHFHILSQSNISALPLPSSNSSSRSTDSLKTAWTERFGNFVTRKKGHSNLTEESLEEFNRRNAELEDKRYSTSSPYYKGLTDFSLAIKGEELRNAELEDKRYSTSSPYYKGLTDFSLAIKGERHEGGASPEKEIPTTIYLQVPTSSPYYKGLTDFTLALNREKLPPSSTSPGRESHVGSFTSTSSRTSFAVKMQDFLGNSCFTFKSKEEKTPTIEKVVYSSTGILNKEPLRERGSETFVEPPLVQTSPPRLVPPKTPQQPKEAEPVSPTKRVVLNAKDTCETKEESKYFWADRYRPENLEDFICNRDKAVELIPLASSDECCHFIFEGMPGVGKRTMIWALLRKAFGADNVQAREEYKHFDLTGEAVSSIVVNVKESLQHVEVNLSELKGYEKHVIFELIKETNKNLAREGTRCSHVNCRAIILYEADKLSTDALLYIRWLLERYKGCNKFFFCCNDVSKLQPIRSICTVVQLLPPSDKEIVEVLEFIARKEAIELPHQLAEKIAKNSKNNLRQAIRSFEATIQSNPILMEDQVILTGWEEDIANIAKNIVEEQSPKKLYDIRRELQKLIEHNVSPEFIFDTLREELKRNIPEDLNETVDNMYKEYNNAEENEKRRGFTRSRYDETKPIDPGRKIIQHFMRIEEFIAKFMSYYKNSAARKAT